MIDITGVNLTKFAQKVYELSIPRGLGFIHAKPGGLSESEAAKHIQPSGLVALRMDYVHGRGCKMTVFRDGESDRLSIHDTWCDHADAAFDELLREFGLTRPSGVKHGSACECGSCPK